MEDAELRYKRVQEGDDFTPPYYEWQASSKASVYRINHRSLKDANVKRPKLGNILSLGAYRVRVIDFDNQTHAVICVTDNWLGVPRLHSRKLARIWSEVKWRVTVTLEIWGLKGRDVNR